MQRPKRPILFLVILSMLSLSLINAANLQSTGQVKQSVIRLVDLGYKNDETLTGYRVDRTYGLTWPEGWKPEPGSLLKLSFSHSQAIKASSSMAVDWNGTRLGSTLLTSANVNRGSLEVQIPAEVIHPGYNQFSLIFYMSIHDDYCDDLDNPSIWATVHSDSSLSFSYSNLAPVLDLSKFPYPFIENSDLSPNQVTFVMAEQPTAAEMNALAIISARLGKGASYRTVYMDVISKQEAQKATGNLVLVAQADRLPAIQGGALPFVAQQAGKARLIDEQKNLIPEGAGYLWEQVSPNDPYGVMLVVTGENETGLLKAASALGSTPTPFRLTSQTGIILDVPRPDIGPGLAGQIMMLKDLGYGDMVARGIHNQTINYNIPLPLAWQINAAIPFEIHFAHSNLLDEKQSALNISLNGTPITNFVLDQKNEEDAWSTVRIPARMFKIGNNTLTIQSTMNLLHGYVDEADCGRTYRDEAWVSVFSDSRLHLPAAPAGMAITLGDYPYAYVGDASLAQLLLVVPDKMDLTIANAVAQITSRLGRYAGGPALRPVVQPAQAAQAGGQSYPYQILIGLAAENSAIQKINDLLPLPFQPGTNQLQANNKFPQVVSPNTGYLQVAQTKEGNPRLVVSGTSKNALLWAAGALNDPKLMADLKGDTALLDGEKSMVTFQIREPKKAEAGLNPPAPLSPELLPAPWVLWAAGSFLGLALLIIAVLVVSEIIRSRQAKKAYETL